VATFKLKYSSDAGSAGPPEPQQGHRGEHYMYLPDQHDRGRTQEHDGLRPRYSVCAIAWNGTADSCWSCLTGCIYDAEHFQRDSITRISKSQWPRHDAVNESGKVDDRSWENSEGCGRVSCQCCCYGHLTIVTGSLTVAIPFESSCGFGVFNRT
jgi:hypothetical protein